MPGRRCICGRSSMLPLCDGAHSVEGWACARSRAVPRARVVAGGPAYQSVVERLAHATGGDALHLLEGPVQTRSLVVVTDGTEGGGLWASLRRVQAETTRLLVIGADPVLVGPAISGAERVAVADAAQPLVLWRSLMEAIERKPERGQVEQARVFLSHATEDEALLQAPLDALRELGVEVFSCGDSIPPGARWWDTLMAALRACDRVLLVLTPASRRSTWCAFEVGTALALNKPVQLLSVDGEPPPSYVGHLQMLDLPRRRMVRPWLTEQEAILDALLAPLAGPDR